MRSRGLVNSSSFSIRQKQENRILSVEELITPDDSRREWLTLGTGGCKHSIVRRLGEIFARAFAPLSLLLSVREALSDHHSPLYSYLRMAICQLALPPTIRVQALMGLVSPQNRKMILLKTGNTYQPIHISLRFKMRDRAAVAFCCGPVGLQH